MESEARSFVARMTTRIHPILTQYNLAQWNLATTGAPEHCEALEKLGATYTRLFTDDPADWAAIQHLHAARPAYNGAVLRHEIELLYCSFAGALPLERDVGTR